MTGRVKHAQRSRYSSHKKPDLTPFIRNGYYRSLSRPDPDQKKPGGLISRLLAPFLGKKHDA